MSDLPSKVPLGKPGTITRFVYRGDCRESACVLHRDHPSSGERSCGVGRIRTGNNTYENSLTANAMFISDAGRLLAALGTSDTPLPQSIVTRIREAMNRAKAYPVLPMEDHWISLKTDIETALSSRPRESNCEQAAEADGVGNPLAEVPTVADPAPVRKRPRGGKGKNIDARMLKAISENREALGWSLRQWAAHLSCAESTVQETPTWRDHLRVIRASMAAEAAANMDQSKTRGKGRRKTKPKSEWDE